MKMATKNDNARVIDSVKSIHFCVFFTLILTFINTIILAGILSAYL